MVRLIYTPEERKLKHKESRLKWIAKPEVKKAQAEYMAKRRLRNPELRMFDCARYRAKRNQIEFSIKVSDIKIPELCPILLIPLVKNNGKLKGNSPTIDRIDNSKGYITGNIAVISHKANSCKSNLTKEDIGKLYEYVFNTKT